MAEPPPASSRTPPIAPLNETTRSPVDSMEDSSPERVQKRPRLDSGSGVSPSVSIDAAALAFPATTASASPPTSAAAPVSSVAIPTVPALKMDMTPDPDPSAEVTLVIKSPMSAKEMLKGMRDPSSVPGGTLTQPHPPEPATARSDIISISSSPTQSPEIQVDDPEDMDENWKPLEEAIRESELVEVHDLATSLVDSFPRVRENLSPRDSLSKIITMINKSDSSDTDAISAVKLWMDDCVKDLDRLTFEDFGEAHNFWQLFPDLVETVLRRQHELLIDDGSGRGPWACLEEFFLDYVQIALQVMRIDTMVLRHLANEPELPAQESICKDYLQPLTFIFLAPKTPIPLYRVLDKKYPADTKNLLTRIRAKALARPIDLVSTLSDWTAVTLELIPRHSHLVNSLSNIMLIANALADAHLERAQSEDGDEIDLPLLDSAPIHALYEVVRMVDVSYQTWITKKAAWATSDLSEQLLRAISHHYKLHCERNPQFVNQLSRDLHISLPEDVSLADKASIVFWVWKMGVLKKHIMEGRMELRVHGVETMQSDLVHVWRTTISHNPGGTGLPFVKQLIRFIQDNKIVDYLVGVDSHPQLISRSSNIVGFLIVTDTYTNAVTDIIWKTVTDSQDGRIVSEVLAMLIRTFNMQLTASPALRYACQKVLELPLSRFDTNMLEFCGKLLSRMSDHPSDRRFSATSDHDCVDALPLQLCVRLIRDSMAADDLSPEQKRTLQTFGSQKLSGFIAAGISEADRLSIYERCIQDIAQKNKYSAGSIQALSALVRAHDVQEMLKLATEFDLTGLVIDELVHAVRTKGEGSSNEFLKLDLMPRLAILFRLIDMVPETITPDLGKALWDDILMSRQLETEERCAAWDMLVTVLCQCSKANPFLDRCIHEYLPSLAPSDYSKEILGFSKQAIIYQVRFNPPPPAGEDEVVTVPGLDWIWTLILTAPPDTIETQATAFAVQVSLDHILITRAPRSAIEATHISIVERCVDHLKSAAASLKAAPVSHGESSTDSGPESSEMCAEELKFRRSLCFLHQFLSGLRARPRYTSPKGSPPILPERPIKGDPVNISWQSFDGSSNSKVKFLHIGDLSTAGELAERLTILTGFSKFTVIAGGQRIDLMKDPEITLREIRALHPGLLLIKKDPDSQEVSHASTGGPLTPVDSEVLKHFDELYDFLTLHDDLAREVYEFLVTFLPQPRIRNLVKSENSTAEDLFPLDKPFVAFYSFSTLLTCLIEEALEDERNQSFISHSIQILVTFLMTDELSDTLTEDCNRLNLASSAVECLLDAVALYNAADQRSLIAQNQQATLVKRLFQFIETARSLPERPDLNMASIQKLICNSFGVLVEGSIRDETFWGVVKQDTQLGSLLAALLLEETRQPIRLDVSERLRRTCTASKSMKNSSKLANANANSPNLSTIDSPAQMDMLANIWEAFVQTFPKTLDHAPRSAEFFNVAFWVFRTVTERSPQDVIFSQYLKQWSEIMLKHETEEFIGREPVDDLVMGFAGLLEECLEAADSANVDLEDFDLAEQILSKYLFPELSDEADEIIVPQTPHMHTETRQKLYNIISLLCKRSDQHVARVMQYLEGVIPRDEPYNQAWYQGRTKLMRAPEGYAGLRNLQNTCYLNSLMTQLFMNVGFREFMLHLNLVDAKDSQKLLDETQKLFAWMQETWTRSVDPEGFVESIRTYENEPIDVTVQMDVDEFYNLLFDRWEAQIMDPANKKKFRSFYGGQLVQQIKSKECNHISEREEPFSAIQCDIKGKTGLDESLQAYVEGEIMQGDNKYFCSGCGRHVDAVKRACLKDVPDNLIFHLKRFDFDMLTMRRSKIDDEFKFPTLIDMTPYKVDHLSDPSTPVETDFFELVGVLVHTGNAESGHYYSYTRERSSNGSAPTWVEFNDADVSKFDPEGIADHCFGGHTDALHNLGGGSIKKVWNAYMLFYQRVSAADQPEPDTSLAKPTYPPRVPVPTAFANHIAMENELFIRTYCLLEPAYAKFIPQLLYRVRRMDTNSAGTHQLQLMGVDLGLDTLEQLIAQMKEPFGLFEVYSELEMLIRRPHTALRALQWFGRRSTSMRNLVLKNPHYVVRQKEMSIILDAVRYLEISLGSLDIEDEKRAEWQEKLDENVGTIVKMLAELWPALHTVPRMWDEYFEFLIKLFELGPKPADAVFANDMLVKCLELIWLDSEDRKNLKGRYPRYWQRFQDGRQYPYRNMMTFCALLLQRIDFALTPAPSNGPRTVGPDGRFALSVTESRFIKPLEFTKSADDSGVLVFLIKLIQPERICTPPEVSQAVLVSMLASEPQAGLFPHILKTLEFGLRFSPAEMCVPFLECAVTFCRHAPDEGSILHLIDFVAKGVESINNSAGIEHLEFFIQLCSVSNERAELDVDWFTSAVQDRIPDFVPTLLIYDHPSVRRRTSDVLRGLIFVSDGEETPKEMPKDMQLRLASIARELTHACIQRILSTFLDSQVQRVESRIVNPIISTITHCLETYFDDSDADDQKVIQEAQAILLRLHEITIEVPDDLISDSDIASAEEWEATSVVASDSDMGQAGTP